MDAPSDGVAARPSRQPPGVVRADSPRRPGKHLGRAGSEQAHGRGMCFRPSVGGLPGLPGAVGPSRGSRVFEVGSAFF